MQTTERSLSGPTRGSSPVRGVVLVAVAVVLGFFVLRALDDTGAGPAVDTAEVDTSEPAAPAGDDTTPPAETTTSAPRPPGEVVVLVANASGVTGAAGEQTEALASGGYQTAPATDSPTPSDTTVVLATPGFEAEAGVLAALIGASEGAVQPMPEPPPLELAGANIVVMLGTDLASGG